MDNCGLINKSLMHRDGYCYFSKVTYCILLITQYKITCYCYILLSDIKYDLLSVLLFPANFLLELPVVSKQAQSARAVLIPVGFTIWLPNACAINLFFVA